MTILELAKDVGAVIGTIGGAFGIWAGYITLRRNQAHIVVEVEHRFTTRGFVRADDYSDSVDRELPTEFLIVTVRNVGNRPARLEELIDYYGEEHGRGSMASHRPLADLVLTEERRRYTFAIDLTFHGPMRPIAVGVKDDRGREYRNYVGQNRRELRFAKRRVALHLRTGRGINAANNRELQDYVEREKQSVAQSRAG